MNIYENFEKPLIKILAYMEIEGIKIDSKFLKKLSSKFEKKIQHIQSEIFDISFVVKSDTGLILESFNCVIMLLLPTLEKDREIEPNNLYLTIGQNLIKDTHLKVW